ncbi:MAG: hypothetical protein ACTHXO_08675, partial [Actinomycetaceae bacterium]
WCFVVGWLADLLEVPGPLRDLSAFEHVGAAAEAPWVGAAVVLAAVVVCAAASAWFFRRRDLRAG